MLHFSDCDEESLNEMIVRHALKINHYLYSDK